MKTFHFFALDVGATSGRTILATIENKKLELKELTRFPNKIIQIQGKFYWDIFALFDALKDGLKTISTLDIQLDGIGIDTWGVDFVYLGEDGSIISQPRSYRDPYTNGIPEKYFKLLPKKEVYNLTGIQIMNFNSLFQLYAAKMENSSALEAAKDILFMPDALSYMLTDKKVCEYTIASTAQLLNPNTKQVETKLLEVMNINPTLMHKIIMPGTVIGDITDSVAKECSIAKVPVIAVAGHDTGSAVVAVPAENERFAYLSSGTWSLMGIEVEKPIITNESYAMNFTNEGGVDGTTRFLKNITGMWLLEQCRKEWKINSPRKQIYIRTVVGQEGREWKTADSDYSYAEVVALANAVDGFQSLIDPDDSTFTNPESMTAAIVAFCKKTKQKAPKSDAEFIRCIFDSLALKYRYTLECLQKVAPFKIEKLHVIGGGAQNDLLNQLTANAIGIPVAAGPSEATAIGNVMMQAKGVGLIKSLQEARAIIKNSIRTQTFTPQEIGTWEGVYKTYVAKVLKKTAS